MLLFNILARGFALKSCPKQNPFRHVGRGFDDCLETNIIYADIEQVSSSRLTLVEKFFQ